MPSSLTSRSDESIGDESIGAESERRLATPVDNAAADNEAAATGFEGMGAKTEWCLAILGGLLLWASFPPLGFWPLAWIAPIPWLLLTGKKRLRFGRPYRSLFVVSFVTWMALIQWVRIPHPGLYVGWVALSIYLASYFVAFFALARFSIHRWHWPLWFAAPVVWTGLEAARSWLLTGFAMMLLAHTQANIPILIQISDIGGPHAVTFVIVLFAALLAGSLLRKTSACRTSNGTGRWWMGWWMGPLVSLLLMAAVVGYGRQRLNLARSTSSTDPHATVALIQGSIDTTFTPVDKSSESFAHYMALARKVCDGADGRKPDLVVWPESMFGGDLVHITSEPDYALPDQSAYADPLPEAEYRWLLENRRLAFERLTSAVGAELGVSQLVGTLTFHLGKSDQRRYNSALLLDEKGRLIARYDKMHPVMFGEYTPLAKHIPLLYALTPMKEDLTTGAGPQVVRAGDMNFSASICFENSVPHLIRSHIRDLERGGTPVHGLITITNDGWFWGSSLLDVHLACGIFRAVENRRPMLIAANTGFSAHVGQSGVVLDRGPRRATGLLVEEVVYNPKMTSLYTRFGDGLGLGCSVVCVVLATGAWLIGSIETGASGQASR